MRKRQIFYPSFLKMRIFLSKCTNFEKIGSFLQFFLLIFVSVRGKFKILMCHVKDTEINVKSTNLVSKFYESPTPSPLPRNLENLISILHIDILNSPLMYSVHMFFCPFSLTFFDYFCIVTHCTDSVNCLACQWSFHTPVLFFQFKNFN